MNLEASATLAGVVPPRAPRRRRGAGRCSATAWSWPVGA